MSSFRNSFLIQFAITLLFAASAASSTAQTQSGSQVANATINTKSSNSNADTAPVFTDYRGVKIGMSVDEVRNTLERYLKDKSDKQDFVVLSDHETAQVFYNSAGKVMAVSIDYLVKNGNAPEPLKVLGRDLAPKPDGSIYAIKRYPAAGYWVSYSRTSGDNPIVSITIQAL